MAVKNAAGLKRKGYHHGNLKQALVAAARALIAERGPAGFTLAEAARLAGVSAAAPYRHFADREALIAEVAGRGFAEFGTRLAAAWSEAGGDPAVGFSRMGAVYLAFAREQPGYYGAMFARGGAPAARPPRKAGNPAFAALEQAIARVAAHSGQGAGKFDARLIAYQVWALSHGIAMLSAGVMMPAGEAAPSPETLLQSGVAALIAGSVRKARATRASAAPVAGARPASRRRARAG